MKAIRAPGNQQQKQTKMGGNRPKLMSLHFFQDLKGTDDGYKQTLQAKMF
jgi:hypothetical protein